jgi:predicted Rossmann fold nucleotide-binding protein DprA/Smf involved in DNA uptake
MDKQQVITFLKDTSKTTLDICAEFNLTIAEVQPAMIKLEREGVVWQSKRRTMGKRKVSRWGLTE